MPLLSEIVYHTNLFPDDYFILIMRCHQVVIVPIWKTEDDKAGVLKATSSVETILKTAGIKVKVDDSEQRTPGWKYNFWEMKVSICYKFCV